MRVAAAEALQVGMLVGHDLVGLLAHQYIYNIICLEILLHCLDHAQQLSQLVFSFHFLLRM